MGYRNYLYKIPKKNVKELRSLTKQQMIDKYSEEENHVYFGKMLEENNANCIFEYGKLYWDDTIGRLHRTGERLFKDEDVNKLFEEEDIYLLGEKALEETIKIYKEKIVKMYDELLNNDKLSNEEIIEKYEDHLKDYKLWWTRLNALNLNKEEECICGGWLYEHQIFELVRLYKTIDFEKYDLLFLGW